MSSDRFELHGRKWSAEDRILKAVRKLEKRHNLDPQPLEDLEGAFREDDQDAYELAMGPASLRRSWKRGATGSSLRGLSV
jgi:hypothetical protein